MEFSNAFYCMNVSYFVSNFIVDCPTEFDPQQISIGSGNDNKRSLKDTASIGSGATKNHIAMRR